jgi:hypothetical protein
MRLFRSYAKFKMGQKAFRMVRSALRNRKATSAPKSRRGLRA